VEGTDVSRGSLEAKYMKMGPLTVSEREHWFGLGIMLGAESFSLFFAGDNLQPTLLSWDEEVPYEFFHSW
jgi:hypothetical protein